MEKLSPQEENKLVKAVEDAVIATKEGVAPNQAIQKVAERNGYTPPFIDVIVGAFNKSKAVHEIMQGNSKYDLADTGTIVKNMYTKSPEKEACETPKKDFSSLMITREENMEKVASDSLDLEKYRKMSPASLYSIIEKCATVQDAVGRKLKSDLLQSRIEFDKYIGNVVSSMRPMMESEMMKVAQSVINAYPSTGQKMLTLLFNKLDKETPKLDKTAFAAVFPLKEPYVSITVAYEKASKIAKAENALRAFEKDAYSFFDDFASNITSDVVNTGRQMRETLVGKPEDLESKLTPAFYNKLKALDAKRKFLDMALYDKDLQKYNFKDLVNSYNQVAQSVPEATAKPAILRNMMLRNLETGGIKDPFELSSEVSIGKLLGETEKNRQTVEATKREKLFPKHEEKEEMIPKVENKPSGKKGILDALFERHEKKTGEKGKGPGGPKEESNKEQNDLANKVIDKIMPEIVDTGLTREQGKKVLLTGFNRDYKKMADKIVDMNGRVLNENQLEMVFNSWMSRYHHVIKS